MTAGEIGYYLNKSKRSLDSILLSTTLPEDILFLNAFEIGKSFDTYKNKDESVFVN